MPRSDCRSSGAAAAMTNRASTHGPRAGGDRSTAHAPDRSHQSLRRRLEGPREARLGAEGQVSRARPDDGRARSAARRTRRRLNHSASRRSCVTMSALLFGSSRPRRRHAKSLTTLERRTIMVSLASPSRKSRERIARTAVRPSIAHCCCGILTNSDARRVALPIGTGFAFSTSRHTRRVALILATGFDLYRPE